MTSLSLFTGGTLLRAEASAAAADDRTRAGILVPWDEPGRTNLGHGVAVRRSFASGLQAGAKVVGIYGHNREAAVSRLVAVEDRPEGLWGRVKVARTPLGDQLLAEIDDGARDGLSIEASDLQFDTDGHIVAGVLDFVAHVPVGAYDSARVSALAATVTPTGAPSVTSPIPAPAAEPAAPATLGAAPVTLSPDQFATLLAQIQPAAPVAAPAGAAPSAASLMGLGGVPAAPGTALATDPIAEAARLQAAVHQNPGDVSLRAALQDVTASSMPLFNGPGSMLGEKLWEGGEYQRRYVGLMRRKPLTSMRYYGWRFTKTPKVAAWAGDKQPISGTPVEVEQIPFDARRCAGGWDVDRKYKDFGDTEFWTEFYREQVESYRELSDLWAAEAIAAAALDVSDDANLATLPADYAALIDATGVPAGPTQLLKAAAIGRVLLENTPKVMTGPDYVMVNPIDWLTLIDLTNLDLPAFLALLKVSPDNFMPSHHVEQGAITLGVRNGMTFRELGPADGTPIRVEALDVARGGIDSAVYGYTGYSLERPGAVISVPLAAAV